MQKDNALKGLPYGDLALKGQAVVEIVCVPEKGRFDFYGVEAGLETRGVLGKIENHPGFHVPLVA